MTDQTDPSTTAAPDGSVDPLGRELTDRLDQAAERVRGRAVTRSTVAARVKTRARHRRQLRAGALVASLVLGAGFASAQRRDDRTKVSVAGQPGASSPTPTACSPSSQLEERPKDAVPDRDKIRSAFELLHAGLLTADQGQVVLAGRELLVTPRQTAVLQLRGLDPAGPQTTTPAPTVPVPPLKPGQTPFDAWVDALRQEHLLTPDQEAQVRAGRGVGITPEQSNFLTERGYFRTPAAPSDPSADERQLSPEERGLIEAYVRNLRSAPGPGPATTEPCAPNPPTTTAASTTKVPATFAPPPTTTAPATFSPASTTTTTSAANGN
ncbi:MAG: hypothetical protein ACR2MB_11910 [Acidimicrobiales bacterium]